MDNVGTLKAAVKAFINNNSNVKDLLAGNMTQYQVDALLDKSTMRAINNARLWAERGHDFPQLEVTVSASLLPRRGINLDRLYLEDYEYEPSGVLTEATTTYWKVSGIVHNGTPLEEESYYAYPEWSIEPFYATEDFSSTIAWIPIESNWFWYWTSQGVTFLIYGAGDKDTPLEEIVWTADDPGVVDLAALEVTKTTVYNVRGHKLRWTGTGDLLLAIPKDSDWWGNRRTDLLRSVVLGTPGDAPVADVTQGEYEVWGVEADVVMDSAVWAVYRMAYSDFTKVKPTQWVDGFAQLGPGYFCDYCRMNQLVGAVIMGAQNPIGPVRVKTQKEQHRYATSLQARWNRWWNENDWGHSLPELDLELVKTGQKLVADRLLNESMNIRLFGQRWAKVYTSDQDTDFFIQEGFDFMMWQAVLELNKIVQEFVPRTEGSLPEPYRSRDEAWSNFTANATHSNYSSFIE